MKAFALMATTEIQGQDGEREQALLRGKKRRDLQAQAVSYLVINAALWAIWAAVGTGYPWPAWFTGAWTIGLLLSAWDVYLRRPITDADVQREMERLRSQG
jgi:2TM domain